jgi:hypothetical protein
MKLMVERDHARAGAANRSRSVQRDDRVSLGRFGACDRALVVKLAKPFLASTNKCLAQSNKSRVEVYATKKCDYPQAWRLHQGWLATRYLKLSLKESAHQTK